MLDALTRSVVGAVQSADVKERFLRVATEPTGYGGDALLLIMKDDALRWGPVAPAGLRSSKSIVVIGDLRRVGRRRRVRRCCALPPRTRGGW